MMILRHVTKIEKCILTILWKILYSVVCCLLTAFTSGCNVNNFRIFESTGNSIIFFVKDEIINDHPESEINITIPQNFTTKEVILKLNQFNLKKLKPLISTTLNQKKTQNKSLSNFWILKKTASKEIYEACQFSTLYHFNSYNPQLYKKCKNGILSNSIFISTFCCYSENIIFENAFIQILLNYSEYFRSRPPPTLFKIYLFF